MPQQKNEKKIGEGVKKFVILSRFSAKSIPHYVLAVTKRVTKIFFCRGVLIYGNFIYFCRHGANNKELIKGIDRVNTRHC